jgi:hypothetical protein
MACCSMQAQVVAHQWDGRGWGFRKAAFGYLESLIGLPGLLGCRRQTHGPSVVMPCCMMLYNLIFTNIVAALHGG